MTIDAIAKVVQAADAAFNEGSHVTLEEAKRLVEYVRSHRDIMPYELSAVWPNFPPWIEATPVHQARIRNFLDITENMLWILT